MRPASIMVRQCALYRNSSARLASKLEIALIGQNEIYAHHVAALGAACRKGTRRWSLIGLERGRIIGLERTRLQYAGVDVIDPERTYAVARFTSSKP
jgi:hypothetical protein